MREFKTFVQADLDIIGNLNILVFECQWHVQQIVQAMSLSESAPILSIESESLIGLEERDLDSGQETRICISQGVVVCSIEAPDEALEKEAKRERIILI